MNNDKINKRKCRMVLFELEEALGSYVRDIAHQDTDLTSSIESDKVDRSSIADLVEKAYLDDIFKYALAVSESTSAYEHIVSIYNAFKDNSLFEVRNVSAHPTRPFDIHYWYKLASVASMPSIRRLQLDSVTSALFSAESGQLTDPPEEWLTKYDFNINNNIPNSVEHSVTGLVGRNKEIKTLKKNLMNPRLKVNAIVAPGGMGKTALALELLSDIVKDPANSSWCDAVFFTSMKTEKLTIDGVERLTASETIEELEEELTKIFNNYYGSDFSEFSEVVTEFNDKKVLLFLDNLETLLRDNLEDFESFNEDLPVNWQVLVTSRIAIPHKIIALEELSKGASIELAKRYINNRSTIDINHSDYEKICEQCFYNPLAIRLTLDLVINGGEIPNSISVAKRDISAFSFSNLIDCLSENDLRVLECIFIEHQSTRQSIHSIVTASFDDIAASISKLSKTSLIERNINGETENYSLVSSVRELLLRSPKDLSMRSEINQKYTEIHSKSKEISLRQKQSNTQLFHVNYIPDQSPHELKILCTELFKIYKIRGTSYDINPNLSVRKEHITSLFMKFNDSKSAYEKYAVFNRCMAIVLCILKDRKAAIQSLKDGISIDFKDLPSYFLLGRMYMENSEFNLAYETYKDIEKHYPPSHFEEEMYARLFYNGLYFSLLYSNRYEDIIRESKNWSNLKYGASTVGLMRATAYKRIAESGENLVENINSAIGIIGQIYRDYGYFRKACDVGLKVMEEFSYNIEKARHHDQNKVIKILSFCQEHIKDINASLSGDSNHEVTDIISRFINFDITNNPFDNASWRFYVTKSDPGLISHDDANEMGLLITRVDSNIKNKNILFSECTDGYKYFSHQDSYVGRDKTNWLNLGHGDYIAIKADYSHSGSGRYPVSVASYIIE